MTGPPRGGRSAAKRLQSRGRVTSDEIPSGHVATKLLCGGAWPTTTSPPDHEPHSRCLVPQIGYALSRTSTPLCAKIHYTLPARTLRHLGGSCATPTDPQDLRSDLWQEVVRLTRTRPHPGRTRPARPPPEPTTQDPEPTDRQKHMTPGHATEDPTPLRPNARTPPEHPRRMRPSRHPDRFVLARRNPTPHLPDNRDPIGKIPPHQEILWTIHHRSHRPPPKPPPTTPPPTIGQISACRQSPCPATSTW